MISYIISYDLISTGKNYSDLYEYLQSHTFAKISESTWFIKSNKSHIQIKDEIANIVDSNDTIFVATLAGSAAWENVICTDEFLINNL